MQIEPATKKLTKLAIASMKSSIKATTLIVHLNLSRSISRVYYRYGTPKYPTRSINLLVVIGMIIPPNDDPVATTPNASDLRFLNH